MLRRFDIPFLAAVLALVCCGFLIFTSASLGLLAREEGATFSNVAFNQLVLGVGGGLTALIIALFIPHTLLRRFALPAFIAALILTALVFVPGIGFEHGGAKRWIHIGSFSFQPSEILKLAFVLYLAVWLTNVRDKIHKSFWYGAPPVLLFLGLVGAVLFFQKDTGTFMIFCGAAIGMFIAAGARIRDVAIIFLSGILAVTALAFVRPHVMDRIQTFMNPANDPLGSGYQVQQSLIAIGSGGVFGRGFGQSVQKFNFLPEPTSDSIYAVAAEEFGFLGAVGLLGLIMFFAWRGLRIATRAPDSFSGLVVVGVVILIVSQTFLNVGSMLGLLPLTGVPLPFVSHGGTALAIVLLEVGIVLRISCLQRKR